MQSGALLDGSEAVPVGLSENFGFQSLAMYAKVLRQSVLANPRVVLVSPAGRYGNSQRQRHRRPVVSAVSLAPGVTAQRVAAVRPAVESTTRQRSRSTLRQERY